MTVKITIIAEGPQGSGKSLAILNMIQTFHDNHHFLNQMINDRTLYDKNKEIRTFELDMRKYSSE